MNETVGTPAEEIIKLVGQLADEDGLARETARNALVEIGGTDVARALMIELNDPRKRVRWEACKALVKIGDPIAAHALVQHLHDEDGDIRWLAAEGVARLGQAGLLTTLTAAIRHARDTDFCDAARHAFKKFAKNSALTDVVTPVIHACDLSEPGVHVPVAAYKALEQIRFGNSKT